MTAQLTAPAPLPVRTVVVATDPVGEAGVASLLRFRPEIDLLAPCRRGGAEPQVAVVVCAEVDEPALRAVREARPARVVVVASRVDGPQLLAAVEAGLRALVPRELATGDRLAAAVLAAAQDGGDLGPELVGRLLAQVRSATSRTPAAVTYGGLSRRELEVLSLLADGLTTAEIGRRLSYSERTIKNVVHDVTTRLNLRNRVHAVAHAVREGLI